MLRLLNDSEQQHLKEWRYTSEDESVTTKLFNGWWNRVVEWVPEYVAPNVLSLAGLILIVFSYHLTYYHSYRLPRFTSLISALLIFFYQTLDAIDGKHARRTKNSSPLGELFDHACDSIGTIFVVLTVAHHHGVRNPNTLFYLTQAVLFLFLMEHLKAFRSLKVTFSRFTGPGEIVVACIVTLLFKGLTGYSMIPWSLINETYFYHTIIGVYWFCYLYSFILIWFPYAAPISTGALKINDLKHDNHFGTCIGLSLCLSMRLINGVFLYFDMINKWELQDVIAHALVVSVIISDVIVAKMAKRELHPSIVVGSILTMFNHDLFIFVLTGAYFVRIFYEICQSQRLFLFTPARNVYICGVFDLTHYGHMKHFVEAAKMGNRLIVGVHSDKDVESYKRKPALSMNERGTTVGLCGVVSEVIMNAPLITTREFIEKHNIHVVGCSTEYDSKEDKYYADPREMGILKIVPRVDGVSTSDIRQRVFENVSEETNTRKNK